MLTLMLVLLLVILTLVLRELTAIRGQVASIRQFLEWAAVGLLEERKENLGELTRRYLEKTKQDLIREGKLDPQMVRESFSPDERSDKP